MTLHHLLTHTSGLGHLDDLPALDLYRPIEPAQELSIVQQHPLLFAPGTRYRYSSPGYTLLAWIVEKTAGQPYASFLADRIFTPLGMHTASAGDPPGGTGMARGYYAGKPVPSFDLATVGTGAGDIWCTAADLLRWDEAVARDELLPARLREAILTPHALTGTTAKPKGWSIAGYAYGWQIGTLDAAAPTFTPATTPATALSTPGSPASRSGSPSWPMTRPPTSSGSLPTCWSWLPYTIPLIP